MSEIKLNSIEDAVKDFKEGKFVIVVDDEDREKRRRPHHCRREDRRRKSKLHAETRKRCTLCPYHPEPLR